MSQYNAQSGISARPWDWTRAVLLVQTCFSSSYLVVSHFSPSPSSFFPFPFFRPPSSFTPLDLFIMATESSPVRDRSGQSTFTANTYKTLLTLNYSAASPPQSRSPSPSPQDTLTLRALVSTKEAGIIIGKAGKNVADLREQTGVKAGVSKVIQGVHERVLTVTGPVEGVSKVYLSKNSIARLD